MRKLVTIDLTQADLNLFEGYEAAVLPLLGRHGGRLEMRVRAANSSSETHLLYFPDSQSYEAYRSDPDRVRVLGDWERCGARASMIEVEVFPAGEP